MKKLIILMSIALIVGHVLTEAHSLLLLFWPGAANFDVHWFWDNITFKINILWWVKMASDGLLQCIIFFVMAKIAKQYSTKLFQIICIYFFYHAVDLMLYFYNYKQTVWVYWLLLAVTILSTILLIWPTKPEAKFRSMI